MIFIRTDETRVTYIHAMPFDEINGIGKSKEELLQDGILIDIETVPEPDPWPGKSASMFYSANKGFWFEYTEAEKTQEEKIINLETELLNTKLAMAELVEQQQADKLNNQLALAELIESIMEGGAVA